jgi:7-cyano-7-deazaguanine synthase
MEAERILKESKVSYTIFRPSYILGPNDELIPDLIEQIGNGTVFIAGNGDIPMQPIYVEDAINGFLSAAENKAEESRIFDLVGLNTTNMLDLVNLIVESMKKMGFNLPYPRIQHIPYAQAPEQLEICKEMIDVMKCDILSDGNIFSDIFGFKLSPLNKAVDAAVTAKMLPEEQSPQEKAIILLSGGIDSATALYWAHQEGYKLIALTYNYHLRPDKERIATKKLANKVGAELIEIPLEYMKEAIDLRIEGFPVPSADFSPEGFIPDRNLIFYSIAAYFAEIYGCNYIIGGHIASDTKIFPDANKDFFKILKDLINKGKHSKDMNTIEILLPLLKLKKPEVVLLAKKLNIPLDWTWSCYSDGEKPCENCSSCLKRRKAFNKLEQADPISQL